MLIYLLDSIEHLYPLHTHERVHVFRDHLDLVSEVYFLAQVHHQRADVAIKMTSITTLNKMKYFLLQTMIRAFICKFIM